MACPTWSSAYTTDGVRWSHHRDLDGTRLVVIDSRAGRVLDEDEWSWVSEQMTGDLDHLLVASSLPWLLAPGMHYLEAWSEAVCGGAWGPLAARACERRGIEAAASRPAHAIARALARAAGVAEPSVRWRELDGSPWFDNQVASLRIEGRENVLRLDKAVPGPTDREPGLERVLSRHLSR